MPGPPGHPSRTVVVALATLVALAVAVVPIGFPGGGQRAESAATTARYAPLDRPVRVLDTRTSPTVHRLPAEGSVTIAPVTPQVAASAGIAAGDVVAVVVNVTLDATGGWGFATVHPGGQGRPDASSINTDHPGQTVANLVTARLGAGGTITVYSSVSTDVLVDVQGVYVRSTTSRDGRFVGVPPRRVLDSRQTVPLAAGTFRRVDVAPGGVPPTASAAVLNVTAVDARGWGFLTVWDGIGDPPTASNVNYVGGSNVANQVIVETDGGTISVFSHAETDLLVDVVGYMTGSDAASSDVGLFVPLDPHRLLDTRRLTAPTFTQPPGSGGRLSVSAPGDAGVPAAGVAAINTNTTMTETTATGFVTVWGDGGLPEPSSLNNVGPGRTVANHVITDITDVGCVNLYTDERSHLIVDVTGYFVGPGDASPFAPLDLCDQTLSPPPPQPDSAPTVGEHAFLFRSPSTPGGYGRWDPCRPAIRYAVNALLANQREIDEMHFALREIERASGFDFVPYRVDPRTTVGLDDRRPPSGADLLIGFSDEARTPTLAGSVLGVGGGFWFPSVGRIDTGFVIIDVPQLGNDATLRATLTHELGHAMGLGHVDETNQLMHGEVTGRTSLGTGDRQGLWRLGTAQPCTPSQRRPAGEAPVLVEEAFGAHVAGR